jgi:hypothetical protein
MDTAAQQDRTADEIVAEHDDDLEGGERLSQDAQRAQALENVRRAGEKPDPTDLSDATAWFLSDEEAPLAVKTFGLNVGKWNDDIKEYEDFVVNWTVQALPRETIRSIQKMAVPARRAAARWTR